MAKKQLNHVTSGELEVTFCGVTPVEGEVDLTIDSCSICLTHLLKLSNTFALFQRSVVDAFEEGSQNHEDWLKGLPMGENNEE